MPAITSDADFPQRVNVSIRLWKEKNAVSDLEWGKIYRALHKATDDYHETGEAIQLLKARCEKYRRGEIDGCWMEDREPNRLMAPRQQATTNSHLYVAKCKEILRMKTLAR